MRLNINCLLISILPISLNFFKKVKNMRYSDEKKLFRLFGKKIKTLRKEHNLSQSALGGKAELEKSSIQRLERGSNVTLKTLLRLANGFDISLSELLNFSSLKDVKTKN